MISRAPRWHACHVGVVLAAAALAAAACGVHEAPRPSAVRFMMAIPQGRALASFVVSADGRWLAAYASQREATVPPDLAAALAASPRAAAAYAALGRTGQYAVILDVVTARTPATRATHVRSAIDALESDRR